MQQVAMTATSLQQLITERIAKEGPLTFAEYMRMALYEPNHGYYVTGPAKMGWEEGDYYNSTDVSAFVANCLGRQLYQWWGKLGQPTPFLVLEQGAGRGHLAQGVQNWAKQEAPDLSAALDYRIADIRLGQDANTPLDDGKQNVRVPLVGTLSPTLHTGRFFPQANKHAPAAGGHKGPNPHPHHPRPYANQPLIHTEPSVILCNEL